MHRALDRLRLPARDHRVAAHAGGVARARRRLVPGAALHRRGRTGRPASSVTAGAVARGPQAVPLVAPLRPAWLPTAGARGSAHAAATTRALVGRSRLWTADSSPSWPSTDRRWPAESRSTTGWLGNASPAGSSRGPTIVRRSRARARLRPVTIGRRRAGPAASIPSGRGPGRWCPAAPRHARLAGARRFAQLSVGRQRLVTTPTGSREARRRRLPAQTSRRSTGRRREDRPAPAGRVGQLDHRFRPPGNARDRGADRRTLRPTSSTGLADREPLPRLSATR